MASGHHNVDVAKHVRVYKIVFSSLMFLTMVTVGASYLHLPVPQAITLALIIATIKGTLVACYFMHLISEQKLIYWILILCVLFFVVLLSMPTWWASDVIRYHNVS